MHHTTAVCTICTKSYLGFARTLFDSVRRAHPEWQPFLLLAAPSNGYTRA